MYLSWKRKTPALQRGVKFIAGHSPRKGRLYESYAAVSMLHLYQDRDALARWRIALLDGLVAAQDREGHEAGSWHFKDGDHGCRWGGRYYCTTMSLLTLQISLRRMRLPLQIHEKDEDEFPL